MVNALHTQVTDGGWTEDDRDAFNSAWDDFFTAEASLFSAQVGPVERRFYNMPATAGPLGDPAFVTLSPSSVGTGDPSTTLPPQCALTVTLQTSIRRRWGRIYLGGFVELALANGRANASIVPTLANNFADFASALIGGGQGLYVWHRQSWTPQEVIQISVDDVWDVQRRRRYDHAVTRTEVNLFP